MLRLMLTHLQFRIECRNPPFLKGEIKGTVTIGVTYLGGKMIFG